MNTMKKIIFMVVALTIATTTLAQKGKLNAATIAYENGDYKTAYNYIEAASLHEKTENLPETWVLKAKVLSMVQVSPTVAQLLEISVDDKALEEALDNASSLDSNGEYADDIAEAAQIIINNTHNSGVAAFSTDKDYEAAVNIFTKKIMYQEKYIPGANVDTISHLIIGASHFELGNKEAAIESYEILMDLGYDDQAVFNTVINYYRDLEDDEMYIASLKKAQKQFPDVENYKLLEIDHLVDNGNIDQALQDMLASYERDPNNIGLMVSLANAYKGKEDVENERLWWGRVVEADPNHFAAGFNLGVTYFNEAVAQNSTMNFEPSTSTPAYMEAKKQRDILAAKAIPYFENAYAAKPDDPAILQALVQYHRMMENAEMLNKFQAELDVVTQ